MKCRVIVFACSPTATRTGVEVRDMIMASDMELIGPYLVMRNKKERRVNVIKMQVDDDGYLKTTEEAGEKMFKEYPRSISLKEFVHKNDTEHVMLYTVPKSSHLRIKGAAKKDSKKQFEYHDNLLQIIVQNFSIVYDLDEFWETGADGQCEVTFLQNIGQFCDPDTFVNTGHKIAVSYD